ncbi:MAG: DUF1461 domain-containing protein [Actinomycetota bacterium]|nr:DUF1461 domain-containing protein [Actinomycetota bacterium]
MNFKNSKFKITLILINSIFLIIIIFFTPLACYVFNLDYYSTLYEENDVFSVLNKEDVLNVTERIFKYFEYREELDYLDPSLQVRYSKESMSSVAFFMPDEVNHLNDVRKLLTKIFILYFSSIILVIIGFVLLINKNIKIFIRDLGKTFIISSALILLFIIILYLLGKNFPVLFDNFHLIFFPQGNFTFSGSSLIITLFPFGFFYDFFIKIVLCSAIISTIVLVAGIIFVNIFKILKGDNSKRSGKFNYQKSKA